MSQNVAEENEAWIGMLGLLDKYLPQTELGRAKSFLHKIRDAQRREREESLLDLTLANRKAKWLETERDKFFEILYRVSKTSEELGIEPLRPDLLEFAQFLESQFGNRLLTREELRVSLHQELELRQAGNEGARLEKRRPSPQEETTSPRFKLN
jgi:hypothetical protein